MFCLRSSVMVRPFQSTSTRLPLSSASLALQSMGLNSTWMSMRRAASRAMSMSKPTSWLFSSRKPMGGKLSSSPTTIFWAAAAPACGAGSSLCPQAASSDVAQTRKAAVSFFISVVRGGAKEGKWRPRKKAELAIISSPADGAGAARPAGRGSAVDQHRDLGFGQHLLGLAAHHHGRHAAAAVRRHGDQVAAALGGALDDGQVRLAVLADGGVARHARLAGLVGGVGQPLPGAFARLALVLLLHAGELDGFGRQDVDGLDRRHDGD